MGQKSAEFEEVVQAENNRKITTPEIRSLFAVIRPFNAKKITDVLKTKTPAIFTQQLQIHQHL